MSSGCRKHRGCLPFCFDGSRGERGLPRVSHGFRALIQLPHRAGQTTQERPLVAPKQTGRNVDEAGRSRSHWKPGARRDGKANTFVIARWGAPAARMRARTHGTIVIMIALRSSFAECTGLTQRGLFLLDSPLFPLSASRPCRLAQQQQQQQRCGCLEPSASH